MESHDLPLKYTKRLIKWTFVDSGGGQGGIAPNNSPRLYIEVYYTVLFNHFSVQFYPILNLEAP